jgi:diadenosine tetraphosphate (Ap4A) HIT family hydrolase
MKFELDPRLAEDTVEVTDWPLCKVLLMNDANYPWLILVPRVAGVVNLHDLDSEQAAGLMEESRRASSLLAQVTGSGKTNVATLGNLVPQLHIHVIARFRSDPAWPGPVWGRLPADPYPGQALEDRLGKLRRAFG